MTKDDQITELQAANTRLVLENRALKAEVKALREATSTSDTRRADVTRFLGLIGDEIGTSPHIPSTQRLKDLFVVAMEEPLETLEAAGANAEKCREIWALTLEAIETIDASRADLVKLADGCIDSQFVFEDVLVACGIDGGPLWAEVAKKNCEKAGGPRDPITNKQLKPDGWTPPDIAGLLHAQGWRP